MEILIFSIDTQQFAIDLSLIERVIRIAEVTAQPNAEEHMVGMINLHGEIIPVIDFRSLINLKKKEVDLSDQLIICTVAGKKIALWIDAVKKLSNPTKQQLSPAIDAMSKDDSIEWIIKEGQVVTLFYNLAKLIQLKTGILSLQKSEA